MKKLIFILALMLVATIIRPDGINAFLAVILYGLAGWIAGEHDGRINGRRDALSGGTKLK